MDNILLQIKPDNEHQLLENCLELSRLFRQFVNQESQSLKSSLSSNTSFSLRVAIQVTISRSFPELNNLSWESFNSQQLIPVKCAEVIWSTTPVLELYLCKMLDPLGMNTESALCALEVENW